MYDQYFVWKINPVITHIGSIQLRYYGIIFAVMLYIGFIIWRWQMRRGGHSLVIAEKFLVWGVIAVLAGSRLGHCLFYEPAKYLSNPIDILKFWQGGLSSHGATLGLAIALVLFARKYKLPITETLDRFSFSACIGAAAVRLGNLFNSEIIGRQTDVPWAFRFPVADCKGFAHQCFELKKHCDVCAEAVPRHPSQIYEFTLGIVVLLGLLLADKLAGKEKRPRGLMAALFLLMYFSGRFCIEFVKEYQESFEKSLPLNVTMGQCLSIIPWLCGVALLVWAIKHRNDPKPAPVTAPAATPSHGPSKGKTGKRRGK